jgi:hypothetical protein
MGGMSICIEGQGNNNASHCHAGLEPCQHQEVCAPWHPPHRCPAIQYQGKMNIANEHRLVSVRWPSMLHADMPAATALAEIVM